MKIFHADFQKKILNLIMALYALITVAYTVIPFIYNEKNITNGLNITYTLLILITVISLIFHKKLSLPFQATVLTIILILSGLTENYFEHINRSYLLLLMAFLTSSLVLRQSHVFIIFTFSVLGIILIGLTRKLGIINNFYINELAPAAWPEWIERSIVFISLSFLITWALTSLRKQILKLVFETSQEKIKYHPLFDQTYSFVTLLDSTGHVIEANETALYFIQCKNSEVKNIFFPDTKWWSYSTEVKEKITKNLISSMNGDFRRFEITHKNIDNHIEYFDYSLKPIFDDEVGVKFIIAEGRNITEFKQARQAVIESEERLLALTESTYEALIISNDGIIVEANQAALKLFQIPQLDEMIGKNFYESFIQHDEQAVVKNKISDNFTKPFNSKGIRKDGLIVPIEIEGRNIIYKSKPHWVSAIRDLTERRLAQKALINSEEKYRLITENIIDIVCKLDENLKFTYASSSVYNMLGYTVSEMSEISIKDITTRESYTQIICKINAKKKLILANSKEIWTSVVFEAVLKHKSGRLLWTHISAKLIKLTKENNIEILFVARNIDAIKKIQFSLEENENSLKKQNEEYERLNKELISLNEELLDAKHKAEESDKLKSAFLANMSHEIRTPMNSIIGFSHMFKNKEIDEEKRDKYADFVINNGKLLLNIVNDILDLSKIESGQLQLKKEIFNLNRLLEELYKRTTEQNHKGLMIQSIFGLDDEDSAIFGDKNRISQVLSNLINNAYKFTKKGAIKIGYQLVNESILFYIEDTGIGIAPEQQEKIFERFRQAEMQTSRIFGGAGLGLSISKKMIELMNGKIWLKSELGKGSTFYVSIPYEKKVITINNIKPKVKVREVPIQHLENNSSILVAEDDESNFFYISELLNSLNYNIIRAKNGAEAVEICKKDHTVKLVLMDVKMPIMDGFESTRQIKSFNPLLPIIAQTAFAMANDENIALQKGCDDYLSKPIDPEILLGKIKKFIVS